MSKVKFIVGAIIIIFKLDTMSEVTCMNQKLLTNLEHIQSICSSWVNTYFKQDDEIYFCGYYTDGKIECHEKEPVHLKLFKSVRKTCSSKLA